MNDEDSRTVWCGNLSNQVTEELLYELFLQAAPIERIRLPIDRAGHKASYAFIILKHVESVPYVVQLLGGISLFDKKLNLQPRCRNQGKESGLHTNVMNHEAIRCNENPRPPLLPGPENIKLYFDGLMQMGQLMNVVNLQNTYTSSLNNRLSDNRAIGNPRDHRRQGQKPYGRNNRFGQSHDRNHELHQKHRRFY